MKIHRNFFTRSLKITDNYLTVLASKSGISLKDQKFITFDQLESICKFLEIESRDYRKLALKTRIDNFMTAQRLNNE